VSVATGAGKPYWSVSVDEPVNQVITTLVSVTVATSRSMTSTSLEEALAGAAPVKASGVAAAAAARLLHMRAWRREGLQQSMNSGAWPPIRALCLRDAQVIFRIKIE